jgi:hypothetical protein
VLSLLHETCIKRKTLSSDTLPLGKVSQSSPATAVLGNTRTGADIHLEVRGLEITEWKNTIREIKPETTTAAEELVRACVCSHKKVSNLCQGVL